MAKICVDVHHQRAVQVVLTQASYDMHLGFVLLQVFRLPYSRAVWKKFPLGVIKAAWYNNTSLLLVLSSYWHACEQRLQERNNKYLLNALHDLFQ